MGYFHVLKDAFWPNKCRMDIAFSEERDKFVVIYLDDITVFFENDEKHIQHLERVFQKCMKFGVSLKDNYLVPKMDHILHEVVGS